MEFARWRQAATAIGRRPRREIVVKISQTQSAKTTEGNLQVNALHPLVVNGDRAAIEASSGYNAGGASHNSYLADFARPARRVNVPEVAAGGKQRQRPLDGQQLRTLSESPTITYRDPGPNLRQVLPYDALLFIDGNLPKQGQDLLQIGDDSNDSSDAVAERLRGSPYVQIPAEKQRSELMNYGNPSGGDTPEKAANITAFNATIVRLMCDGMAKHWDLLMEQLPKDGHSQHLIDELRNLGRPEWYSKWLPFALRAASPEDKSTDTLAIYQSYLYWHDENGEGRPATRRAVSEAVVARYGLQLGERKNHQVDGKKVATNVCPGWVLTI